jgi:tetratricopeptide (TPR) repeat protein
MARIFLSYVHDDQQRARLISAALERAGHSVWWDRQIKGGSQFSAEIETALADAERVVVLWSQRSVKSAWVRDEAAAGRDSGRLVPVTLDGTSPPLGFRQFQTIDLSRWAGRGRSGALNSLIQAVGAPETKAVTDKADSKAGRVTWQSTPRRWQFFVAMIAALLLLIGGGWWLRNPNSSEIPVVAVEPANGSPAAQQLARDLSLRLADLPTGDDAFQLISGPGRSDLVLQVGGSDRGQQLSRDLSLMAGKERWILWSANWQQPASQGATLPQQIAVEAQRAVSCAADALSYRREQIRQDTLKQYVSGCTGFDSAYGANQDNSATVKLFEQVVAKAPNFEAAWAKLIALEIDELWAVEDSSALQRKMASQIKKAQDLGLDFGELYAAKAVILSPSDFIGIFRAFDEGLRRHPDNALLYRWRGERWMYVGRMNDSVADVTHAVQLDPLSPANQQTLASAYAYAGNSEAGYAQLKRAEQLWPGAPTVISARYRLDLRFGDPREAKLLLQQPFEQGPLEAEQAAFIEARIDPSPSNIERSIAEDRKIYQQYPAFVAQIVQTLGQFGRKDEVLDILLHYSGGEQSGLAAEVLFRPALKDVWRDPRSMAAAAHLGLLQYWKATGNWPDFCSDPTLPYNCKKEASKYRI